MELNVTQLRKSSNEIRQANKKGTQRKCGTPKRNLWNSTRFDLKTKKQHH